MFCVRAEASSPEPMEFDPVCHPRVLLVDDDVSAGRAFKRSLERANCHVTFVSDGEQAASTFDQAAFDLVVSDLEMPNLDGLGLLRLLRERDEQVPLIMMTGSPSAESAISALNLGAVRYLTKPFPAEELVSAVTRAAGLRRLNRLQKEMRDAVAKTEREQAEDRDRFEGAIKRLYMAFQPIVHGPTRSIHGHEALVRTWEQRVSGPQALFELADRFGEMDRLGRRIRNLCAEEAAGAPEGTLLFVNVAASDLLDPHLLDEMAPLSRIAKRVVLEVTETCTSTHLTTALDAIGRLRDLGFRIAIDDVGAGYSGLNSFALVEPDVVKLDLALIRDVDKSSIKRRLIESFTSLCHTLGIDVIAEGVETAAEYKTLLGLGCELFQGYLFAKPEPFFWDAI